jgi:WD40 repeat protein
MVCVGTALADRSAKIKVAPLEKANFSKVKLGKTQSIQRFASQAGHNRHLTDISVSADGAILATASGLSDGLIKVWDVATGSVMLTLDSEDYVSLSPDGKWVAGGNVGGPIKVWDVTSGKLAKTLQGSGPVRFVLDGTRLIGEAKPGKGVSEGTLEAWNTSDWSSTKFAQPHQASLSAVSVSAGGDVMVTGSYDESIKIWDVKSGELLGTIKGKMRTASALAISPDLKLMAVSFQGSGAGVEIWDTKAKRAIHTMEAKGNVISLAFAPDGKTLAGATTRGVTQMWGIDGAQRGELADGGGQVVYSPDGSKIIHGYQSITVSDAKSKAMLTQMSANDTEVFQTVFTSDNKRMLTTDARSSVEVWDLKTGDLRSFMTFDNGTRDEPKGELILSPDGTLAVLRPFVGGELTMWSLEGGVRGEPQTIEVEGLREMRGVTFAPEGKDLVIESSGAGGEGTQIVWWNLEQGKQLNATKFAGYVNVNGFVDGGKTVALLSTGTTSGKMSLKLWDRDSGLVKSIKIKDVAPFGGDVDLASQGNLVALGDADNTVKLWDRSTSKIVATLKGHTELVSVVEFSPDGRLLATGGWDETVRIWDAQDGKLLLTLEDMYQAQHISFSPHDDVVAISHHGWLKLIHLPTGRTRKLYYDEAGDQVNWLIYDGSGHFECKASGCDMVRYRTNDGELIGAEDKRIKKLRGVEKFGR